jgi:CheY-like chemotaxis protein
MTTILVVDDSAVDRSLAGGLLENDPTFQVQYAAHGTEALAKIQCAVPDLVVTDLMMPGIDGLELVALVRSKYPLVPTILMTSRGSEEIAVRALQQGASSYVPKRTLAQDLLETARGVLAVSRRKLGHRRLLGCIAKNDCSFVFENDGTLFEPLISYLQEAVTNMGLCDEAENMRIGVALSEALANAAYHGNLEIGSQLREEDDKAYYALIEERLHHSPYKDRRIRVQATLLPEQATFVISDEGSGFDPSTLPDPTDLANLDKVTGRGILLMRTFMDEVTYNNAGNKVTLAKRRNSPLSAR